VIRLVPRFPVNPVAIIAAAARLRTRTRLRFRIRSSLKTWR
jgi:hypothetical protein